MADPTLEKARDGSYMTGRVNPPQVDILDDPIVMSEPFTPNVFSQIVINPYPLYDNDASLTGQERIRPPDEHLCFVTNRVRTPVPTTPNNPPSDLSLKQLGTGLALAALNAISGPAKVDASIRFQNFANSQLAEPDVNKQAIALIDFLAGHFEPGTISAAIHYLLEKILPVRERWAVSHELTEVLVWGDRIPSVCVEAAFTVPGAIAFVPKVFNLVKSYAKRTKPGRVGGSYVGGYLSLRIVGQKTDALLGMQKWSPTCCVEYLGLAGTRDVDEFVDELQRLALTYGGILHLGLQNNVLTARDVQTAFGNANVEAFRKARAALSQNGAFKTFDNSFTDRLGLSALPHSNQSHWRWCRKCQGLFFGGNANSRRPAGGEHDKTGSGNYSLSQQHRRDVDRHHPEV